MILLKLLFFINDVSGLVNFRVGVIHLKTGSRWVWLSMNWKIDVFASINK